MHKYSRPTRTKPTAKIKSTQVAHVFFLDRSLPQRIPDVIMTANDKQFVGNFFMSLFTNLQMERLTLLPFHLQTNG